MKILITDATELFERVLQKKPQYNNFINLFILKNAINDYFYRANFPQNNTEKNF